MIAVLLALLQAQQVVVENPAPYARAEWARAATPDGFRRTWVTLAGAERAFIQVIDPSELGPMPAFAPASLPLALVINGTSVSYELVGQQDERPCVTFHLRGRAGSFVSDLWATACPGQSVVPFELLITFSDPNSPAYFESCSAALFGLHGVQATVHWAPWRGSSGQTLLENQTFWDTQSQAYAGFLALEADASGLPWLYGPAMAAAMPAEWRGKWGPFGTAPEVPNYQESSYINEIRNWFLTMVTTAPVDPWRRTDLGLLPNANSTGGQQDFGASKLAPFFSRNAGGPLHSLHAYQASLMEACRPSDFREGNGQPVEPLNHPNWVTWAKYTHFHRSVSSDRLGKPLPAISMHWTGGWTGQDREHWSVLNLTGAYLLTGSPLLLHLVEREALAFLSGETLDPRLSTTSIGAPRGIGRTLLTAAWVDCCLSDGELRNRFRDRVTARLRLVEAGTRTRTGASLSPLGLMDDIRIAPFTCIQPWQEALGIIGLRAAELRFGGEAAGYARTVLERCCATFVDHGWWKDANGRWWEADAFAWNDGQPLPPEAYPGPLVIRREGFEEWSWGAVIISDAILDSQRSRELRQAVPVPSKIADAEWIAVR